MKTVEFSKDLCYTRYYPKCVGGYYLEHQC